MIQNWKIYFTRIMCYSKTIKITRIFFSPIKTFNGHIDMVNLQCCSKWHLPFRFTVLHWVRFTFYIYSAALSEIYFLNLQCCTERNLLFSFKVLHWVTFTTYIYSAAWVTFTNYIYSAALSDIYYLHLQCCTEWHLLLFSPDYSVW